MKVLMNNQQKHPFDGDWQTRGNTTKSTLIDWKNIIKVAAEWEWTRGRILGIGGFSSVYVATKEDDGLQFAVKSVGMKARDDFEMKSLELLQNEIKLMERLRSKYIVR